MSNPYQSPGGFDVPPQKFAPYKWNRTSVDYSEAFNFAFSNPNYLLNLILLGIVNIIPIIGPIVVIGYFYDDYILLLREGRPTPSDFKFEKFMAYLQRGVMPFLAALLVGLVLGMMLAVLIVPVMIIAAIVGQKSEELGAVIMGSFQLGMIPIQIIMGLIVAPAVLRVGISGKFEEIANYKWALAMVKAVWVHMIVGSIVVGFVSFVGGIVGILLCCIGIIPVAAYISYFNFSLQRQWYEIFTTQGGEPVPVSTETFQ